MLFGRGKAVVFWTVSVVAVLAGACAAPVVETTAQTVTLGCVDDSKACIDERRRALDALLADKQRGWIRQPATASAYATGVRLFAYKTEKQRLNCDELAFGRREANAAASVLRSQQGQGLTPAQISRGIMFAEAVGGELSREAQKRCRA